MKPLRPVLLLLVLSAAAGSQPLPAEARLLAEIHKYEQIVADNPRDIEFRHQLADLYREGEMWDKAIDADTEAIKRYPKYAAAFYGRAKAKVAKQDYATAVADFNESIRLFELRGGLELYLTLEQPSDVYIDSYRSRGVALSHLNRFDEGIADLTISLKLRKDDATLLYEKGYLEEKAGRRKDAVADYQRSGLIYAESYARKPAQECAARLDGLGAKAEAEEVRRKMEPKKPKSDLP